QAPTNFVPYHPATTNYQVPGDGLGWNVRSVKMPNVTQAMMNELFSQASMGNDQIGSFWAHLPETDFLTNITRMAILAQKSAALYPGVPFRYCTAVESMQRFLKATDQTPPQLEISETGEGETVTYTLRTDEPIFQPRPFVATKDIFQRYRIVPCVATGTNTWTVTLPVPRSQMAKAGVAVTDLAGNLTTRLLRFFPDDIFIDNLDPQYSEWSGNWTNYASYAWGTNSRVALVSASADLRVRWTLPVTESGSYNVLIQVPFVYSPASNLVFNVRAGDTILQTISRTEPLPPYHWLYLANVTLDAGVTNALEMVVDGASQPGAIAIADVVKLSPLAQPLPGFIKDVVVDAAETTANISWTTIAPASGLVKYGSTPTWGAFTATNQTPATKHVVTLTGLQPGVAYYFQVSSATPELTHTMEGSLVTATRSAPVVAQLFDLTGQWKYTTANFDGVTNWTAPNFEDSAWHKGNGLLWADARPGKPSSKVSPRGTEMPGNLATGYPFPAYSFRRHFNFPGNLANPTLTFTNYLDDGAVFYLNGVEVRRVNMPPVPVVITNATRATDFSCGGDATCPVVFSLSGSQLSSLVAGDNLLAVEVHNYTADSPDITFGAALTVTASAVEAPRLGYLREGNSAALYWNGAFVLQQATHLGDDADWADVPAPAASPYAIPASTSHFYRLRY
ncbi:MAG TPA: fibronectin type III domain-containing protein, partial [Verrucomicrobiae bacterium]|nr:fibronectin type III domain-containing protein [Verrucomicrobiae bacterium]